MAGCCPHLPEAWKKELKDLASRVTTFTKENELKNKEVGVDKGAVWEVMRWVHPFVMENLPSQFHQTSSRISAPERCCCWHGRVEVGGPPSTSPRARVTVRAQRRREYT